MNLFEEMKAEYIRLSAQTASLERAIDALPEGSLEWRKRGNTYRYYRRTQDKKEYIAKSNPQLIEALAKKKYLQKMLIDAKEEKTAISKYLNAHKGKDRPKELIIHNPNIENLLRPLFVGTDEKLAVWAAEEYPSTAGYPNQLIHPGPLGKMYRSKAEASIAYVLFKYHLPNRYECDKTIGEVTYHIDFTIRNPENGQTIYWEHCGMMDNDRYAANIGIKLKEFEKAGIFPDRNLILTFESKQFPFETWMAEEIVHQYFCLK